MNNSSKLLSKPILSFCTIVKNENKNLHRCLASVKAYVDEMIVVDTGSSDGTPENALNYGAKVKYFEWCDDFAAARNYAISQASGDWILMLDADEELVVMSDDFLDELRLRPDIIAYLLAHIEVNDQSKTTPAYRMLLFRNISGISYVGRFHEKLQYLNQDNSKNQVGYINSLKVLHYGYNKEQQQQKNISRDIPMLERIREESELSLRLLASLAGMYENTQQPEKAQECFEEVFKRLLPHLIEGNKPDEFYFIPALLYNFGIKLLANNDYETARLVCQRGIEWCPNYPSMNYLAGTILRELGFPLGASAYFKKCIQLGKENSYYRDYPFSVSFMTTYPAYGLGLVYLEMERLQEAIKAFELALAFDANFTEAQEQIDTVRQLLATNP